MNRFNTLYYGDASDAADELNAAGGATSEELRVALINAMRQLARLEDRVAQMEEAAR